MPFHNVSLPDEVQYGSSFGPSFATTVQGGQSGHEVRIAGPEQAKRRLALVKDLQSSEEAATLKSFALGRRGAWASFRVKDWSDYSSAENGVSPPSNTDQLLGTGDGSNRLFYLQKTYDQDGPLPYIERIKHYVDGTLLVALDGSPTAAFTVNADGVITFTTAPGLGVVVTAGFEYDVAGRFESNYETWVRLQADSYDNWSAKEIAIVTVLDESEWPDTFWPGGGKNWHAVGGDLMLSFQDGVLQRMKPLANINVVLPPPEHAAMGQGHFTIVIDATASFVVQVRDDTGAAIGSTIAAAESREFGFVRDVAGTNYYWTQS